ncbi:hypothetical protein TNCV_2169301 [Trichonephila clavipes]|nr:hypothetical protein TNCV_2169301 [Trichonephila clavipes]
MSGRAGASSFAAPGEEIKHHHVKEYILILHERGSGHLVQLVSSHLSKTCGIHAEVVEDAMGSATTTSPPLAQVDSLIQQVAENGLDIIDQLAEAKSVPTGAITSASMIDLMLKMHLPRGNCIA